MVTCVTHGKVRIEKRDEGDEQITGCKQQAVCPKPAGLETRIWSVIIPRKKIITFPGVMLLHSRKKLHS